MASKINVEQYIHEIKRRMSLNIDEDIAEALNNCMLPRNSQRTKLSKKQCTT